MVCGYEPLADHHRNGNQSRQVLLFAFFIYFFFFFFFVVVLGVPRRPMLEGKKNIPYTDQDKESISLLEPYCSEFLIHAADVEGLQQGIDGELVSKLSEWCSIPVTYAGGARSLEDLEKVHSSSRGKVDLTIGSALDIFGGSGVTFDECIQWNKTH